LVAAVAVATACVALPAQAATTAAPPHTASATTSVPLLTGGQVVVRTNGDGVASYAISTPAGDNTVFQSYQDSTGDHYTVPAGVAPYLGRQLDSSLFDVSALARDGITDRIPVALTFTAGVTPAAPPGVTLTSAAGATATGYLSSASTSAFGAALRKQALPAGLTSMRLAAPAAPPAAAPHFPLTDLQINAVGMDGKPVDTSVFILNTDAVNRERTFVPVTAGVGRIAVPAGHYFALADMIDLDSAGYATAVRQVVVNDFTVAAAPAVNTVTVDERTASSAVDATTPKPATQDGAILNLLRFDAAGGVAPFGLINIGAKPPLYVSPAPAATVGKLHYVYQWDGAGSGYRYDVAFPSDNSIPADETFVVKDSQLATVTHRFNSDSPTASIGSFLNGAIDEQLAPLGVAEVGTLAGQPMPAEFTQYLGTADGGMWAQTVATPNLTAEFDGDPVVYRAGRDYRVDWGHGPLAPGFGRHQGVVSYCTACTAGSTLGFGFNEFNDSVTTHSGYVFFGAIAAHLVLDWNGTKFVDQQGVGVDTALPAAAGTLHAVLDTDRGGDTTVTHAITTHTDVTVKVSGSDAQLPEARCAGYTSTTPCHVLPALALTYDLASDLSGSSTSPVQVMSLDVSHLSFNDVGSHARITSATVSVSFDNGETWRHATLVGFNGKYVAFWQNPLSAKGTKPSLRVTAADADGNSISQTVTSAYTYAGSAS